MIIFFVIMLSIIAWIRTAYPQHFVRLKNSSTNSRIMRQVMREESSTKRENFFFFLNFFLASGMMLYLADLHFSWTIVPIRGIGLYLVYVIFFLAVYVAKSVVIRTVQFLAEGDYGLNEFHYNLFLSTRVSSLFLVPLVILGAYLDPDYAAYILGTGLLVLVLFYLYGLARGIASALRSGVEVFYIFFYICTLEILPLLVLYKVLSS